VSRLVGRYEILQQLGGGGFAITFLARDHLQPSKPLCVVKQLRPHHTDPHVVEFFEKEAAILERLGKQHPQIPQLLAHFSENQNLYIVQEYIEGQDLSKEIVLGKRLSEGYVTKLLQEVLEVLSFVHQQDVIHRDIKPQNLMRRHQDGKIFLIDFGAVKELASLMINAQGQLVSSLVIGTPGYMSN
jgi:serine/threonine protein kinase